MPGKKPNRREQELEGAERVRHRLRFTVVAVAVVLSLFAAWTMLAHSGAFDSGFGKNSKSKHSETGTPERTVSPASLNPNSNPSKEYIHGAGSGRLIATEEPCVSDTQPPTFPNCPSINVAAAFGCPYATSVGVNYVNPVATDNCAIMTVVCNPASGSNFPVGANTVTCMVADTSGNTATCSFAVNVFSACLVDEADPGNVVLFNASTGDYRFCCNGVVVATGRSTPIVSGCSVTIDNVKGNRHINISVTGAGSGSGSAYIQKTPGPVLICQISDSRLTGNACTCP